MTKARVRLAVAGSDVASARRLHLLRMVVLLATNVGASREMTLVHSVLADVEGTTRLLIRHVILRMLSAL